LTIYTKFGYAEIDLEKYQADLELPYKLEKSGYNKDKDDINQNKNGLDQKSGKD